MLPMRAIAPLTFTAAAPTALFVKFDTTDEVAAKPEFVEFGKDIAMQIAAANPSYLNREAVPAEAIENEKKDYHRSDG